MPYRDEHEALRARLDATEQRLHDAESALAQANLRVAAAEIARASRARENRAAPAGGASGSTPRASDTLPNEDVWTTAATISWALAGIPFVFWQVTHEPRVSLMLALVEGLSLFWTPAVFWLALTARRRRLRAPPVRDEARLRVAVAADAREIHDGEGELTGEPLDTGGADGTEERVARR